mmetsp:Transcript_17073/g.55693  ORF Transcript_17073/g.55693 Transcript_17073/m.55693 type:complete len:212 (-) Transcript_17073:221-856(-)
MGRPVLGCSEKSLAVLEPSSSPPSAKMVGAATRSCTVCSVSLVNSSASESTRKMEPSSPGSTSNSSSTTSSSPPVASSTGGSASSEPSAPAAEAVRRADSASATAAQADALPTPSRGSVAAPASSTWTSSETVGAGLNAFTGDGALEAGTRPSESPASAAMSAMVSNAEELTSGPPASRDQSSSPEAPDSACTVPSSVATSSRESPAWSSK